MNRTAMKAVVAACAMSVTGSAALAVNTASIDNITQGTNHPTIQDANDNANPGDVIEIGAGTVCENSIVIDRSLTIRGQGMDATIIDGQLGGRVMNLDPGAGGVGVVEGLTIMNGLSPQFGGGMRVGGTTATLSGVRFLNNQSINGGGLFRNGASAADSSFTVDRCEFIGNYSDDPSPPEGRGGAMYLAFQSDNIIITNTLFDSNRAADSGTAIYLFAQFEYQVDILNCTLVEHPLADMGGAFLIFTQSGNGMDANVRVANCVIDSNDSGELRAGGGPSTVSSSVLGPGTILSGGFVDVGGNTTIAPMFEDAAGGDFRLASMSSGIDIGDLGFYFGKGGGISDLNGDVRIINDPSTPDTGSLGSCLDAGAYERQAVVSDNSCTGDLNGDGVIDTADLGILIGVFGTSCP